MQFDRPFRVITSAVDGDILSVLARAEHEFTIADLARKITSRSAEGIRLAMDRLIEQGVISIRQVGPSRAFSLNRDHLSAPAIVALAELPETFHALLAEEIGRWQEQPHYVALFGSAARGEMRPGSDIDIALVRLGDSTDLWAAQVKTLISRITVWTGNDTRPIEFSKAEVMGAAHTDGVIRDILRDGITIVGDRGDFRALVGAP
ncbi:MAG: nucleotidyltransferase domain-containing protein [Pseudolysinimonas sp.]|uniref:nucleotidyltransferase domain-containing protein n=1 Tax=Pseudolysinimonas sp. TaxID=2680009 RepID=UPI0032631D1F